jgi:hypothetical protein
MPKMRIIESKVAASGPTPTPRVPSTFPAEGAQRLAQGIGRLGEIMQKHAEQNEISKLNAQVAGANAKFTRDLRDTLRTADPNDEGLVERFMEGYDAHFDQIASKVSTAAGQRFLEVSSANLRNQIQGQVVAGKVQLAKARAKANYIDMENSYAAASLDSPASMNENLAAYRLGLEASIESGLMSRHMAETLRPQGEQKIAVGAMNGLINLNPHAALKELQTSKHNVLLGGMKQQLIRRAEQAIRAEEADILRAEREAERQRKKRAMEAGNEILQKLTDGTLTHKFIVNHPDLEPVGVGGKKQWMNMLKEWNKGGIITDNALFVELFQRIMLPWGHENKIIDENELNEYVSDRRLTFEDYKKLRAEIQGRRTVEGRAESAIKDAFLFGARREFIQQNEIGEVLDPRGPDNYKEFLILFEGEYQKGLKAGKSPSQLLSKHSPDYLGKWIPNFKREQKDIWDDVFGEAKVPRHDRPKIDPSMILPRKPGETLNEWMHRRYTTPEKTPVKTAPLGTGGKIIPKNIPKSNN